MIQVTFNREATYRHLITSGPTPTGLHYRRWDMTSKHTPFSRNYSNISDASVARLFRVAMEYGYWFEVH